MRMNTGNVRAALLFSSLVLAGCGEMTVKEIHGSLRDYGFWVPPPATKIDAAVTIEVQGTDPDAGANYAQALAEVLSEDLGKAFTQPSYARTGNEPFVLRVSFVLNVGTYRGGSFEVESTLIDNVSGSQLALPKRVSNKTAVQPGVALGWPQYREVVPAVYQDLKTVFDVVFSRNARVREVLAKGRAAEQRDELVSALSLYTSALQEFGVEDFGRVVEVVDRAIDVALRTRPRPAVPADAARHAAAALAKIKTATTKDDLMAARRDYLKALALAPWWANAWFNLAVLNEQIGAAAAAAQDLERYLRSAPEAADRPAIEQKVARLQASIRDAAREAREIGAGLVGKWNFTSVCSWGKGNYDIHIESVENGHVTISGGPWNGSFKGGRLEGKSITMSWGNFLNSATYTGTLLSATSMQGTFTQTTMGGTCAWSASKL